MREKKGALLDDASEYLDDWMDEMLVEFLEATDFNEETYDVVCSASGNLPAFNVPC